eukprot:TRINITY_DN1109_c0_g1_i1.p1 TRINITY_DN1109_c0_g1~~TRINITY_DN1109_c0_g1_i1.p1  ORF type:complete len:401 (-),score=79.17 TRINITY_DN1109_c0_g1_i1:244-1446(-)
MSELLKAQAAAQVVEQVAGLDKKASLESWGGDAFTRRARSRLHAVRAPAHTGSWNGSHANILLLGPTGSGKSSLIYTWWRALSGDKGFEATAAHADLMGKLNLGWELGDVADSDDPKATHVAPPSILEAAARHGTTRLEAFELRPAGPSGVAGIAVHDTKGQQFFTHEEERFAEHLLEGKLLPGSTAESRNYRYWFMLGQFGIGPISSLASAPHAVVLVFDVTLRSFEAMLRTCGCDTANGSGQQPQQQPPALVRCYRSVLRRARQYGLEVFAALTHVDAYEPDEELDSDSDSDASTPKHVQDNGPPPMTFNRDRDMPALIERWQHELCRALCGSHNPPKSGPGYLVPQHVFAMENYRASKSARDTGIDLAALEFLESVVAAGHTFISSRCNQPAGCIVS